MLIELNYKFSDKYYFINIGTIPKARKGRMVYSSIILISSILLTLM